MIDYQFSKDAGWFRIFGYGFQWRDTRKTRPLFSELMGYRKRLVIWHWAVGVLRRDEQYRVTRGIIRLAKRERQ